MLKFRAVTFSKINLKVREQVRKCMFTTLYFPCSTIDISHKIVYYFTEALRNSIPFILAHQCRVNFKEE
jgi:hypothetical protein